MMFWCLLLCFGIAVGYPSRNGYPGYPGGSQSAMMFGSYYNNPLFRRSYDYVPQGSMSAIVTRDTVATNAFAGPQPVYPPLDTPIEENVPVEKYTERAELPPLYAPPQPAAPASEPVDIISGSHEEPFGSVEGVPRVDPAPDVLNVSLSEEVVLPEQVDVPEEVDVPEKEDVPELVVVPEEVTTKTVPVPSPPPSRVPKKSPRKPVKEEEQDEWPTLWPVAPNKGPVPSYNAFFPITISGLGLSSRAKTGSSEEDHYPGPATAIANSFSTGKGGIATSHATSFGDPYLAALVRNALLNFRSTKPVDA